MYRFISVFVYMIALYGCSSPDEVVVYVSEDQVFSEPILRDFQQETGISVRAVYDTEEAKGTGVMNRLLAEKNNPQADVYWANEPIRAELLKQEGVTTPYVSDSSRTIPDRFKDPDGYWTGFSARARVFVVHNRVEQAPEGIEAYTDPDWQGNGIIANPLFGTTTTHIAALYTLWGEEKLSEFLNELSSNQIPLSTSNGESADMVASGAYDFSLVDTDDAVSRQRQGRPVHMVYPDKQDEGIGTLILPNAVMLIHGSSNAENGKKLIDYLLSRETERKLAESDAAQIPLHPGVPTPESVHKIEDIHPMEVDYAEVARALQTIQPMLKEWVDAQ